MMGNVVGKRVLACDIIIANVNATLAPIKVTLVIIYKDTQANHKVAVS